MARKNQDGNFILSAGEIGAYTVCPESWRLKNLENVKGAYNKNVSIGKSLHQEWAKKYDESLLLSRGIKLVLALIFIALITYIILNIKTWIA